MALLLLAELVGGVGVIVGVTTIVHSGVGVLVIPLHKVNPSSLLFRM